MVSLMMQPMLPKPEKLDSEIDEIAKKIRAANEMVRIKTTPLLLTTSAAKIPPPAVPEIRTDDWTSIHGQFGWIEIANTLVPYLTRSGETYVSVRMADIKIFAKYRTIFSNEVHDCFKVVELLATKAEAQLLNEINFRHCDNIFGRTEFTTNDTIISLRDVNEIYEFYKFCYLRLVQKNSQSHERCGFIRIGSQSNVPYVTYEHNKYVPIFYFEGECKYLEERSINLDGWALSYLKLACKVQGIRKPFFDTDSLTVVELELLKKFFPPNTLFEEFWTTDCKVDGLLQMPTVVPAVNVPDPQKRVVGCNKEPPAAQIKSVTLQKGQYIPVPVRNYPNGATRVPPVANQAQNQNNAYRQNTYYNQYVNSTVHQTVPHTTLSSACVRGNNYNSNRATNVPANNTPTSMWHPQTGRVREVPSNNSGSKLFQISDVNYTGDKFPYYFSNVQVESIILNRCFNKDPFTNTNLLLTFEDVAIYFKVPVEKVANAVNVMHLDIFLPNKLQVRLLSNYNMHPTRGLIYVSSFIDNLPQLRYILTQS